MTSELQHAMMGAIAVAFATRHAVIEVKVNALRKFLQQALQLRQRHQARFQIMPLTRLQPGRLPQAKRVLLL